jgi:tetratricopeptide (TPR) repeat protein
MLSMEALMSLRRGALVLAALGLAAPALAQDWTGTGRLEGKVIDPDGKPVADVVVKLDNPRAGGGPTVKTNKKGQWAYLGLAAGNWNIDFEAAGFAVKKVSIALPSEATRLPPMEVRLDKAAPKGPPPEVLQAIEKGDAAYKEGKWAEARAEYEKLLALRPELASTLHLQIARCHKQEGNIEKELDSLQKVLDADPANADIRTLMAMEAIEAGMVDRGVALLEGLDQAAIKNPDVFFNIGVGFVNQGKPDAAITFFSRAIAADPAYVDGYFQRGMTYLSAQKLAEAKADFQKVLELDPSGPKAEASKKVLEQIK